LLQLSRYIHRNPVETKPLLVPSLDTDPWSSYLAYIKHTTSPHWLQREFIDDLLGHRQQYQGYRLYVEAGVDDEIKELYQRGHPATVIGDKAFLPWVREQKLQEVADKVVVNQVFPCTLTMAHIINLVAAYYKLDAAQLTQVVKGPQKGLLARKVAMYLCQQLGGYRLADIMRSFGLSHVGSVSFITTQIRKRHNETPDFAKTIQRIKRYLMKHAT